ncbi:MAG: metallophosphoesterase [Polyangiales bacterium]
MAGRTFVIGDIHGELEQLQTLLSRMPRVTKDDTIVLLGDYLDRGPDSRGVLETVRRMDQVLDCLVIPLRGNHEDAWLRVVDKGWPEFLLPTPNGCLAALRSFTGGAPPQRGEYASPSDWARMERGSFFHEEHVAWMRGLPYWYEDEHGIYVHAGLLQKDGAFVHPSETMPEAALLWTRSREFFTDYRGKHVVVGHTKTNQLPSELSSHTPEDPTDLWAGPCVTAIDTGCGSGGFLTALELPAMRVYESR